MCSIFFVPQVVCFVPCCIYVPRLVFHVLYGTLYGPFFILRQYGSGAGDMVCCWWWCRWCLCWCCGGCGVGAVSGGVGVGVVLLIAVLLVSMGSLL